MLSGAAALAAAPALARPAPPDDDDLPPNVFISPCGQPFRAPERAPYPVVAWFKQANKAGDGKLTKTELVADAAAFFDVLDRSHNGVLDPFDIQFYERRIAPEVLGVRVDVTAFAGFWKVWRAQYGGLSGPGGTIASPGQEQPLGPADQGEDRTSRPQTLDVSGEGAAPYSFFAAPEPVTAADTDLNGFIRKEEFLALAQRRFAQLDNDGQGYLTLAGLPKTKIQIELAQALHARL